MVCQQKAEQLFRQTQSEQMMMRQSSVFMKHHSCRDAGCGGVHLNQMALVPKGKKRKIWDFSQDSASIGNKYAHILEQRLFGNSLYYGHTHNRGVLFVKKRNRD